MYFKQATYTAFSINLILMSLSKSETSKPRLESVLGIPKIKNKISDSLAASVLVFAALLSAQL